MGTLKKMRRLWASSRSASSNMPLSAKAKASSVRGFATKASNVTKANFVNKVTVSPTYKSLLIHQLTTILRQFNLAMTVTTGPSPDLDPYTPDDFNINSEEVDDLDIDQDIVELSCKNPTKVSEAMMIEVNSLL